MLLPPESSDSSSGTNTVATTTTTTATSTSAGTGPMTSTSGPVETTTGVDPDPSTTIDPDPTTGVVTTDASSSSEGSGCPPGSECTADEHCPLGAICLACICIGGCELEGSGTYGACLLADGSSDTAVCRDDAAVCIVDTIEMPTVGVCLSGCADACDCPPFPGGFDEQVTCEDLSGDGIGDCYLDCAGGQSCPDDMTCVADTVCMWPPG